LIDTIAMIGSPGSRGALASAVAPGRACLVAASAVSGAKAAIAASVRMAGTLQRRVAMMDCVLMNRLTMSCPGSKGLSPRPSSSPPQGQQQRRTLGRSHNLETITESRLNFERG